MKKIIGKEKSLTDLLANKKYTIHYYQREYRWGKKQIEELVDDLSEEFLENYKPGHERTEVATYGHYYLGSVVLTSNDGEQAIIDGQQRLTSLTLLLIYLNNLQADNAEKVTIDQLIFSEQYGKKSFNIQVNEREACMDALYKRENFSPLNQNESVVNIFNRHTDIADVFPEEIKGTALPFFIDWLINKVFLVEITATTEQDAHKIFVSMNDRGLSLTPTEMLKGYLLSEIKDDAARNQSNELWKKKILEIKNINPDSKEEDADFIKTWLRAQYAETIRDTKRGAVPEDFDLIGTEFHKWVRENAKQMKLEKSKDYEAFILKEFNLFADLYISLKNYSTQYTAEYSFVFFNADRNFTLQYQLLLAAVDRDDSQDVIKKKIVIIAAFIDQYITRRVVNYKAVDYSTIKNAIFNLTKKVRKLEINTLVLTLQDELNNMDFTLDGMERFYLNQFTSRYMLHILSRITFFIDQKIGLTNKFEDYVNRTGKNPYDIEHIWCNDYQKFAAQVADEDEFNRTRNLMGGLLILPRDKNRSYQDADYSIKLPLYFGENILAKSLHQDCYRNNPHFINLLSTLKLSLSPIDDFTKDSFKKRQQSYKEIAEYIWSVPLQSLV
jgi:uncharacterized protein with ParB-like and HNH nuclease domain